MITIESIISPVSVTTMEFLGNDDYFRIRACYSMEQFIVCLEASTERAYMYMLVRIYSNIKKVVRKFLAHSTPFLAKGYGFLFYNHLYASDIAD